jgi:hypothetical protein
MGFLDAEITVGYRVNILVNGDLTDSFECCRGDPLSSYLFILTADGLNRMITRI